MDDKLTKAVGRVMLYDGQQAELQRAYELNPDETMRLVERSHGAQAPGAVMVNGARRIVDNAETLTRLGMEADSAQSEKRLRSLRNFARTALVHVPAEDREAYVRDEFHWANGSTVQLAVSLAEQERERHERIGFKP